MNIFFVITHRTIAKAVILFGMVFPPYLYANPSWPAGAEAAVSITYDDGYTDNIDKAMPTLEINHVRGTFYLTSDIVDAADNNTNRDLKSEWQDAYLRGHEVGSHSEKHLCAGVNHVPSQGDVDNEVNNSIAWLDTHIGQDRFRSYAYPCGTTTSTSSNTTYYQQKVANRFYVARTGAGPFNNPVTFNRVLLKGQALYDSLNVKYWSGPNFATPPLFPGAAGNNQHDFVISYVKHILEDAATRGDWVVFIFHHIVDNNSAVDLSTQINATSNVNLHTTKALHDDIIELIATEKIGASNTNRYWVAPVRNVAHYAKWFLQ